MDNKDNQIGLPFEESTDSDEKLYYSMGETSEMFHLPASTLRYWEQEFDLLKPRKNKKGEVRAVR